MTQITARDFMVTDVITVSPAADVIDAVRLLLRTTSQRPVVDWQGNYLGVFSEKCSMHVLLDAAYEQLPVHDVRSFMDAEAQTIALRPICCRSHRSFCYALSPRCRCSENGTTCRHRHPSRRDEVLDAIDRPGLGRVARDVADVLRAALFERHEAARWRRSPRRGVLRDR